MIAKRSRSGSALVANPLFFFWFSLPYMLHARQQTDYSQNVTNNNTPTRETT